MKELYDKIIQAIGLDKFLHFFVCAFLVMAFSRLFPVGFAAFLVAALGALKEYAFDGKADWKDLVADLAGIVLSVTLLLI